MMSSIIIIIIFGSTPIKFVIFRVFVAKYQRVGPIVYVYLKCLTETSRYNFLFSMFYFLFFMFCVLRSVFCVLCSAFYFLCSCQVLV
ncbi:MAG: hypothetical protein FVQ79_09130 [Planctomycetes bacterium]|nr:hypothetical protein [Planctomycetota bacterium]